MIKHNNNSFSSVYDETTVIGKIYKGTLKVYEAWKKLIASGVPPLKIYSKGINKDYMLPNEYQEVEYIESTGTQYINTDYTDVSDTRIELDFVYTGRLGTSSYMGANGGNVMAINSSGALSINASSTGIKPTAGDRYKITSYRGVDDIRSATLNGVEYIGTKASRNELYYIFTLGGQSTSEQRIYGKLYSCKIYHQDELVRDFIPCYRKSDNVIGVYDLVNDVFYTNAGTGTFLKGKNVATGLDLIDYKIYGNSVQSKVPNEYQQVDYVEGTGTQYIELDYIASNITNSKGTFQLTNTSSALMLFGARTDGSSNGYALNWGGGRNPCVFFNTYYSGGTAGLTDTSVSAEITAFEKRGVELYINDELIHTHSKPPAFTTPYKMIVFGCNSGGNISYFAKAKIFNLQFYDNDELKIDLIPCYRKSDNEIGMYDTVTGTFYTNKGTGTFAKGSDTTLIPTPEEPIEIESVGEKSKNLFDYDVNNSIDGWIRATNEMVGDYSWSTTDYIKVNGNSFVLSGLNGGTNPSICAYDDDKNFITGVNYANTNIVTISSEQTISYVRFSYAKTWDLSKIQLEEGTVGTELEPFGYRIPVRVSGKNLLKTNLTEKTNSDGTVKLINNNGEVHIFGTSTNVANMDRIFVIDNPQNLVGKTLVTKSNADKVFLYAHLYTTNGETVWNWISQYADKYSNIVPEDARLIEVGFVYVSGELNETIYPQIEVSTVATEYEPYVEPITTNIYLKEPLRKMDDYADYIDFKNKKVVRNIHNEFITIVNSKSSLAGTYTLFLTNVTELPLTKNTGNNMIGYAISNKFLQNKKKYIDLLENGGYIQPYVTSKGIVTLAYSFNDANVTTVEQAQEKIGSGFDVNYVLETPTEETIELPNIPTFKGTTIIEVETKVQPSNMEVIYIGKEVK